MIGEEVDDRGEREMGEMTRETFPNKELVPSLWLCVLQKKGFRGIFFF